MNTPKDGRMIRVNRAPVLTLWATVVAERLGFERDAALTLGRAVAGSSAQMKGRALGIYEPSEEPPSKVAEERRESLKPDETLGHRSNSAAPSVAIRDRWMTGNGRRPAPMRHLRACRVL
jgi:hypothetical protein